MLPSTVLKAVQSELRKRENRPPEGVSIELGGEASKRGEAVDQLMANVSVLAAGMIFVLVFSLKSFRATMVIFCIAVFSFGMAFFSLWATGFALGFTAIVGTMGMVGIAINDSIVVLSELRTDPSASRGDLDAILGLVMRSTRHVLSTTFTVGMFLRAYADRGWHVLAADGDGDQRRCLWGDHPRTLLDTCSPHPALSSASKAA